MVAVMKMNVYLDLSIIYHILLMIFALHFVNVVDESRLKISGKCKFIIFSTPLVLTIYVSFWVALAVVIILEGVLFWLFYKSKFILPFLEYLVAYYYLAFILDLISPYIRFLNFHIVIGNVKALWTLITMPIAYLLLYLVSQAVDKMFHLGNYKRKLILVYQGQKALISGYFDTGNTLKYKGLPVIFIKSSAFPFLLIDSKEEVRYQTVNGMSITKLYKASLRFEYRKESDVYFALSDKGNFNGCECLLNAYLGV